MIYYSINAQQFEIETKHFNFTLKSTSVFIQRVVMFYSAKKINEYYVRKCKNTRYGNVKILGTEM